MYNESYFRSYTLKMIFYIPKNEEIKTLFYIEGVMCGILDFSGLLI